MKAKMKKKIRVKNSKRFISALLAVTIAVTFLSFNLPEGKLEKAAAAGPYTDPSYWTGAFTLADEEGFLALSRIVNGFNYTAYAGAEKEDYAYFGLTLADDFSNRAALRDSLVNGKFNVTADIDIGNTMGIQAGMPLAAQAPAPTESATPAPVESAAPSPSESVAPTPSESVAPTPSESVAPTPSESVAPTPSESATPAPSESATPSPSESGTALPPASGESPQEPTGPSGAAVIETESLSAKTSAMWEKEGTYSFDTEAEAGFRLLSSEPTPEPTPSVSVEPEPTPSASAAPEPTPTESVAPEPTPSAEPTESASAQPTETPAPSESASTAPAASESPSPSVEPSPSASPSEEITMGAMAIGGYLFPGIGTGIGPFKGEINGNGHTIKAAWDISSATAGDTVTTGLFNYVEDALFYNFTLKEEQTVNTAAANTVVRAGALIGSVGMGAGATIVDTVTTQGTIALAATSGTVTAVQAGGIAAVADTYASLNAIDCNILVKTAYTGTNATASNITNIREGKILATLPTAAANQLVVQQLLGLTIYAYGPKVERTGVEGVYTVEAGTPVYLSAVNEGHEFNTWSITGATPASTTNATTSIASMPSGPVVVSAFVKPIAGMGRTFDTAYTIPSAAALSALERIVENRADPGDIATYFPGATRAQLQAGYFKITATFTTASGFNGIGNSAANSFTGKIDAGYLDASNSPQRYTVTLFQNTGNEEAYSGLVGYLNGSTTDNALLRNLDIKGGLYSDTTKAPLPVSYMGGLAGYAINALAINCNASVEQTLACANTGYVGGLVGRAETMYLEDCVNGGQVKLLATAADGVAAAVHVGGAMGFCQNTICDNVKVILANKASGAYDDSRFEASTEGLAYAGGFAGYQNTAAANRNVIRNCSVARIDDTDSTPKVVTAVARKSGTAYAGGFAGYVSAGNATNTMLKNFKFDMGTKAALSVIATDSSTEGADACATYAGGIAGTFITPANYLLEGETQSLFGGSKITVLSRQYGKGKNTAGNLWAGGLSGQNLCRLSDTGAGGTGKTRLDISGLTVRTEQKAANQSNTQSIPYVGGLVGQMQTVAATTPIENLSVTATATTVEGRREPGNRAGAPSSAPTQVSFFVGGLFGSVAGSGVTSYIRDIDVTLKGSRVLLNQLSYDSEYGRSTLGGIVGYANNINISNVDITLEKNGNTASTIAQESSTGSTATYTHGWTDPYTGGIVGYSTGGTNIKIENCNLTGMGTADVAVSLKGNQHPNSPSVGGIVGYAAENGKQIIACSVDSAYVLGDSNNDSAGKTDTDIIVGGIVGLTTGTLAGNQYYIADCIVQNSKVAANGRDYTLAYAGGIAGSEFSLSNGLNVGGRNYAAYINRCVAYNNQITVSGQKSWAAGGGICGYHYDGNMIFANCLSIDNNIRVQNTGARTTAQNGVTFDALSIGGGILGKTATNTGNMNHILENCYSNATFTLINPVASKISRGGLVGYKKTTAAGTGMYRSRFNNSFFHMENAGTDKAVDLWSNISNPQDGDQISVAAAGTMNVENNQNEVFTYCGLDFSLAYIETAGASIPIFGNVQEPGMSTTSAAPNAVTRVTPDTSALLTGWNNVAGTTPPYGYMATAQSLTDSLAYANFEVGIDIGNTGTTVYYPLDAKPIYLGKIPATQKVDLYKNAAEGNPTSGSLVTAGDEIHLAYSADGTSKQTLRADVIYSEAFAYDFVNWQVSEDSLFTTVLLPEAITGDASVAVVDNYITFTADIPIDDQKVFYVRAKSATDNIYSPVLKIVIDPVYVNGVMITNANAGNRADNPLLLFESQTLTLKAQISPANATVQDYSFSGYTLNGNALGAPLAGVKADGTIFGAQTYPVVGGNVFAVLVDTVGKADPATGASGLVWNSTLNTSGTDPAFNRTVRSEWIYVKFVPAITMKLDCENGYHGYFPPQGVPGQTITFTTYPNPNMGNKPQSASYKVDGGDSVLIDLSGVSTEYSYDGSSPDHESTFTLTIPENATSSFEVTVTYFSKLSIQYFVTDTTAPAATRIATSYVDEADILTDADVTVPRGYKLGGWFTNAFSVTKKDASLSVDYKNELVPSSTEIDPVTGDPVYHDLLQLPPNINTYRVEARLQYDVSYVDSASMDLTVCDNVAVGEKYNKNTSVNQYSDLEFTMTTPSTYVGQSRYALYIGGVRAVLGTDYTTTVNGNRLGFVIPAKSLVQSKIATANGAGVQLYNYYDNVTHYPKIDDLFTDPDLVAPKDGEFTILYNLNHAQEPATGSAAARKTYAYAHLGDSNTVLFRLSNPLPKDTIIRVYRRSNQNTAQNQEIYWYKVSNALGENEFNVDEFRRLGRSSSKGTTAFSAYLGSAPASPAGYVEQFFITFMPPAAYDNEAWTLVQGSDVTIGLGSLTPPGPTQRSDSNNQVIGGSFAVNGLQDASISAAGGSNKTAGDIAYTLPAAPQNNYRHDNKKYGLSFYAVDTSGDLILLPAGTKITFDGDALESTTTDPLSKAFFEAKDGSYELMQGATALPPGWKLMIELVEVPEDYIYTDVQTGAEVLRLANAEVRWILEFAS